MRPKREPKQVEGELFQSELEQIIDLDHPLVRLGGSIDGGSFASSLGARHHPAMGAPGAPRRLMVALRYLKPRHDLSDEDGAWPWLENPYWRCFSGERCFPHRLPIDASSMTRWRIRLGEAGAEQMLRETMAVGVRQGAIRSVDLKRVNVDTTVQSKAIRSPTGARLHHRCVAVTSRGGWLAGASSFTGNPDDGHTLAAQMEQVGDMIGNGVREAHVDMGYRGHDYSGDVVVHVDKRTTGRTPKALWRWMKRRAAVEPSIGHLKSEHRLERNRLRGAYGDAINAMLAAAAMNFHKLLEALGLNFLRGWRGIWSQLQAMPAPIGHLMPSRSM